MKIKIITTTSDISKCYQLERSLKVFGYDYHFIQHEWNGFLDKIRETYKYLKSLDGYTHFLYTDAWDTFALQHPNQLESKINKKGLLFSAERACYPYPELASEYPENKSHWKYVNGGGWCGEVEAFIKMYEAEPPTDELNDQVYFTRQFLKHHKKGWIKLDYECSIFQTLAFCPESDFEYDANKVFNTVTKSTPIFIHGNGHTSINHIYKLLPMFETFEQAKAAWANTKETHKLINETFAENVNADEKLKAYRDWIEEKIFGFGERSFLWMWKLILAKLPANANFLEIGVFRGQVLGAARMLAPKATITGVTPLDNTDGHFESDYAEDIKLLHKTFKLKQPNIIKGLSTDEAIIEQVGKSLYDVIYIDGGHSYDVAKSDVYRYSSFVKVGGYLVIDDCANKYDMPDGYFKGIADVSRAVDELLPNEFYKEVFSVVHNRVFQRVK